MTHNRKLFDRLAPFALGLPDADEDGALAAHLAVGCDRCAAELSELRETAALLALGAEGMPASSELRTRILERLAEESFAFVLSSEGGWQEVDGGVETKALYTAAGGGTSFLALKSETSLAAAYRPGHLGYVVIRGALDAEGIRLDVGEFVRAVPGDQGDVRAVSDTILLAVAGTAGESEIQSPMAVSAEQGEWSMMEPGTHALPLARSASEGIEIALLRMDPGAAVSGHKHKAVEELCLLSGDCRSQGVELGPEDYHRAMPGTIHGITTTVAGCTMVYITRKKADTRVGG